MRFRLRVLVTGLALLGIGTSAVILMARSSSSSAPEETGPPAAPDASPTASPGVVEPLEPMPPAESPPPSRPAMPTPSPDPITGETVAPGRYVERADNTSTLSLRDGTVVHERRARTGAGPLLHLRPLRRRSAHGLHG